jgi:hypothetical protein
MIIVRRRARAPQTKHGRGLMFGSPAERCRLRALASQNDCGKNAPRTLRAERGQVEPVVGGSGSYLAKPIPSNDEIIVAQISPAFHRYQNYFFRSSFLMEHSSPGKPSCSFTINEPISLILPGILDRSQSVQSRPFAGNPSQNPTTSGSKLFHRQRSRLGECASHLARDIS